MSENALRAGTILQGRSHAYRIERVLGQGSFGITYLATTRIKVDGALGALETTLQVAVKEFFMEKINGRTGHTVSCDSSGGIFEDYRRKFAREAQNLGRLKHPHIVKVLESFEANNTVYYAMEYCAGGSLDGLIAEQNGLSEAQTLDYFRQIADALDFMHGNRMLHLDLKPANIMLRSREDLALIDFGLAKQYNDQGEPESSTNVGAGTPGYAPVEQASYRQGADFPAAMDVYALGGTLFKMLTGKRPPEASVLLNEGFPAHELQARGVSDPTIGCIARAMQPMKRQRYQTVAEFSAALLASDGAAAEATDVAAAARVEAPKSAPLPDAEIEGTDLTDARAAAKSAAGPVSAAGGAGASGSPGGGASSRPGPKSDLKSDLKSDPKPLPKREPASPAPGIWDRYKGVILGACFGILVAVGCFVAFRPQGKAPADRETELLAQRERDSLEQLRLQHDLPPQRQQPSHPVRPDVQQQQPAEVHPEAAQAPIASATTQTAPQQPAMPSSIPEIPMVYVAGGTFTMGASASDTEAYSDEKPAHSVMVSSFYIGKYEVTQAQWKAVMGSNPSYQKGDNLPVETVPWNDIQEFIRKLNAMTGKTYRLPTEAEWEFAARGGNKSQGYKYSGSNSIDAVAWYDGNSGKKTHPVGTKAPNELGIYDMSGNVYEWCSDRYGDYSSTAQTNPKGPSSGSYRVFRGGCWNVYPGHCRVSSRSYGVTNHWDYYLGFRLAMDVERRTID